MRDLRTVSASTMIAQVWCAAQGQMSHEGCGNYSDCGASSYSGIVENQNWLWRVAHPFCFLLPVPRLWVPRPCAFARAGMMLPAPCGFWVGQHKTVTASLRGTRPSHRTRRTGHPFIANASDFKSPATRLLSRGTRLRGHG